MGASQGGLGGSFVRGFGWELRKGIWVGASLGDLGGSFVRGFGWKDIYI